MTTKGRPELQKIVRQLQIGACNLSKLRQVVDAGIEDWRRECGTTGIPNGYAGTIAAHLWTHLQSALAALVTVEALSDAPGRPVMDRVQELERDLEAMTAEARRNLQDRDAFWLRVEELERMLAALRAHPDLRAWQGIETIIEADIRGMKFDCLVSDGRFVWEAIYDVEREAFYEPNAEHGDEYERQLFPTHWMPLPDPPDVALRSLKEGRQAQTEASAAPQEEE